MLNIFSSLFEAISIAFLASIVYFLRYLITITWLFLLEIL